MINFDDVWISNNYDKALLSVVMFEIRESFVIGNLGKYLSSVFKNKLLLTE